MLPLALAGINLNFRGPGAQGDVGNFQVVHLDWNIGNCTIPSVQKVTQRIQVHFARIAQMKAQTEGVDGSAAAIRGARPVVRLPAGLSWAFSKFEDGCKFEP